MLVGTQLTVGKPCCTTANPNNQQTVFINEAMRVVFSAECYGSELKPHILKRLIHCDVGSKNVLHHSIDGTKRGPANQNNQHTTLQHPELRRMVDTGSELELEQ